MTLRDFKMNREKMHNLEINLKLHNFPTREKVYTDHLNHVTNASLTFTHPIIDIYLLKVTNFPKLKSL